MTRDERERRLVSAARVLIRTGSLRDTAASFHLSPSWLARALRSRLPSLAPDLVADVEGAIAKLRSDRPHVAAEVRWAHLHQSWGARLLQEAEVFVKLTQQGDRQPAHEAARRIRAILDAAEEGDLGAEEATSEDGSQR